MPGTPVLASVPSRQRPVASGSQQQASKSERGRRNLGRCGPTVLECSSPRDGEEGPPVHGTAKGRASLARFERADPAGHVEWVRGMQILSRFTIRCYPAPLALDDLTGSAGPPRIALRYLYVLHKSK